MASGRSGSGSGDTGTPFGGELGRISAERIQELRERGGSREPEQFLHHERSFAANPAMVRANPLNEEWSAERMEQAMWLTTVDKAVHWAQSNSIWPAVFGLACCAIEMMSVVSPRYDLARFGAEVFRASPRQADLLVVSGRVAQKMAPAIRQIYDQMLEPKWVIAMGACSSSGGMFPNYAVVQGVHKIIPVDVHVPGCPPRPEQLMHGVLQLQEKIRRGEAPAYMQEVGNTHLKKGASTGAPA